MSRAQEVGHHHEFYRPQPEEVVLVHAAAGGVGLLLLQWAKHLGARVIGTVSTEAKAKAARDAGADHVILYTEQDFVAEAQRLTKGRGADLILDGVGKTTFAGNLTGALFVAISKRFIPIEDTGQIFASTEASQDVSLDAMREHQQEAAAIIARNPYINNFMFSVGSGGPNVVWLAASSSPSS